MSKQISIPVCPLTLAELDALFLLPEYPLSDSATPDKLIEDLKLDYGELMAPVRLLSKIKEAIDQKETEGLPFFVRQSAMSMDKPLAFLLLTLISDGWLRLEIPDGIRKLAAEERKALFSRVTDLDERIKIKESVGMRDVSLSNREISVFERIDEIEARLKGIFTQSSNERSAETLKNDLELNAANRTGILSLKNFHGYLFAEAIDERGKLLRKGAGGFDFLAEEGQPVQLIVWLGSEKGNGKQAWEEIIVTDGAETLAGAIIRFELSADASYGDVRPSSSGVLYEVGEKQSESAVFRYQGGKLPVGEHSFWVSCHQGYHFLQGLELKIQVQPNRNGEGNY